MKFTKEDGSTIELSEEEYNKYPFNVRLKPVEEVKKKTKKKPKKEE